MQSTIFGKELIEKSDTQKESKKHEKNSLNDLNGTDWIKFTKSWFIADGKKSDITRDIESHPASFPPDMICEFIKFFTKENETVLDPFLGTGSTLVACDMTKRKGIGIELIPKYAKVASQRTPQLVIQGDARTEIKKLIAEGKTVKFCITSPPYWNILQKTKDYTQQKRKKKGLDLQYSEQKDDFGNITEYARYLEELSSLFFELYNLLERGGHLVIIVQNVRDKGETTPIAFDLTNHLRKKYKYLGEKIWCQNQKTLRPYGYPFAFVSNVHHHFCLIFKK